MISHQIQEKQTKLEEMTLLHESLKDENGGRAITTK